MNDTTGEKSWTNFERSIPLLRASIVVDEIDSYLQRILAVGTRDGDQVLGYYLKAPPPAAVERPSLAFYGQPETIIAQRRDGPFGLLNAMFSTSPSNENFPRAQNASSNLASFLMAEILNRGHYSVTDAPRYRTADIVEDHYPLEWEVLSVEVSSLRMLQIVARIDAKTLKRILIALVATYGGVANYTGFKEGTREIVKDISTVAQIAADGVTDLLQSEISRPQVKVEPFFDSQRPDDEDKDPTYRIYLNATNHRRRSP